jgi:hypothetical protein
LMGGISDGNIVANNSIVVGGTLDASAPNGGDGGFIETSAANVKIADDIKVTTLATNGNSGTWLIDPTDFNIGVSFDGAVSNLSGGTLSSNLESGNVIILSSDGTAGGAGNVNVNEEVLWDADTRLTLTAVNNININGNIAASGALAGITLNPNTSNGADTATGTGALNMSPGVAISLPNIPITSLEALNIAGASYRIINSITDLQNLISNGVAGNYALGSNIDASATSTWNAGAGFAPINGFTGNFNGLGQTVDGLFINRPSTERVGLFGTTASTISSIVLANVDITGTAYVGALVGHATLSTDGGITSSYATGTVNGTSYVGGLVGWLTAPSGDFSSNYSRTNVNGDAYVGGLIGWSTIGAGNLTKNYATGNVAGTSYVGGLVGWNTITGDISDNYATGNVTGASFVGGLLGWNTSTGNISNTYSAGLVLGSGASVGGLVGYSLVSGTASSNYWDVETSGMATSALGTPKTSAEMQLQDTFIGRDFENTWYMPPGSNYPVLQGWMKELIITTNAVNRVYDGLTYSLTSGDLTYSMTPEIDLLGALTNLGTSEGAKDAGDYTIIPLYADTIDYMITYVSHSLNINPKSLTATVIGDSRAYDGSTTATTTITISDGLVGTETVTATGGATFNTKDVSTATTVTVNSTNLIDGTDGNGGLASNYSLGIGQTIASTITTKGLTIVGMAAASKVYDGNLVAILVGGSLDTGIAGEALTFTGQTGTFADWNVANGIAVTVTSTALGNDTGGLASNYSLTQPTGLTADITAALGTTTVNNTVLTTAKIQKSHLANANFILPPQSLALFSHINGARSMLTLFKRPDQRASSDANARDSVSIDDAQSISMAMPGTVLVEAGGVRYRKKRRQISYHVAD